MSDVKAVNDAHQSNDLQRRRELHRLDKTELIDYIVNIEDNLAALATRIEQAYGEA